MKIQGIALSKIAEQVGTPFYVYDGAKIKTNVDALRASLPNAVKIYYSLKANPNRSICKSFKMMNLGAEVCSQFELETALRTGFKNENIIFLGPGKKVAEIKRALLANIYAIVCESIDELEVVNQFARDKRIKARVAIRINPDFSPSGASLAMGGRATQFGMSESELTEESLKQYSNINICGMHIYNGTRILSAEKVAENTQKILLLSERVANSLKINFDFVDIGGGIGIPYYDNEHPFELEMFKAMMLPIINQYSLMHPTTKIILESGRYLMGNAGYFVTKVQQIKKSHDINFLVTDGGMNCHLTAAGYGAVIKKNFPISTVNKVVREESETYNITGPLCTPSDVIGKNVQLPQVAKGDLIVVHESGAYGPTASPTLFLGHGYPAEILIEDSAAYVIREPDSIEDMFQKQVKRKLLKV